MQLEEERMPGACPGSTDGGATAVCAGPGPRILWGARSSWREKPAARAFQHEMDHLDGRVFVEHLRGIKPI